MTDSNGRKVDVRDALAALPELERRAVVLAYYQAVPHGQLAAALSTTQSVAMECLHRGALTLRAMLATPA